MAAKAPGKQSKQVNVYSSDSLMLRMVLGIVILALGVLMIVANVSGTKGTVFDALNAASSGLAGAFSPVLAFIPIWGGILILVSTRRKPPIKPYVLSIVFYLCLLAVVNLLSHVWDSTDRVQYDYMSYIALQAKRDMVMSPDAWGEYFVRGYKLSAQYGLGGAMGMLLAWPLFQGLGQILSSVVLVVAMIALAIFICNIDVKGIVARTSERRTLRQQEKEHYNMQMQAYYEQQAMLQQQQQQQQPMQQAVSMEAYPINQKKTRKKKQADPQFVQPLSGAEYEQAPYWGTAPSPARNTTPQMIDVVDMRNATGQLPWESGDTPQAQPEQKRRKQPKVQRSQPQPFDDEPYAPQSPQASPKPATRKPKRAEPQPEKADHPTYESSYEPLYGETAYSDAYAAPAYQQSTSKEPDVPRKRNFSPKVQENSMSGKRIDQPQLDLPPSSNGYDESENDVGYLPYVLPTLNLLKAPVPLQHESREEDMLRARRLEETLESFKIPSRVHNVVHGPAIARYELEIAAGINVSRVSQIDKNIAMNLECKSVRIEAPIPGKSLVGVEVPNRSVTPVMLREVLESEAMRRVQSPLAVALGKDIAGEPIICDIAAMPHILIAGATGSGKSVCINAIINSILYRAAPEDVRMILIDPKVVELQCYNCVPHLLLPVISDPHKAAGALAWVVSEMMERYHRIQEKAVRDINGYNDHLDAGEEKMPRIVVIIDELADLMMSCKKEVEEYICRIAQLARAAGIHLIVATQRPSVDVITGLIKSNIPSRIAFTVSSNIDSRTILDRIGAEKLLGKGDMLYFPKGEGSPLRVQGCFLSDAEVNRVMDFMKQHTEPRFDPNIIEKINEDENALGMKKDDARTVEAGEENESYLQKAIEQAVTDRQTSISMLQRRFRIGYARAGSLIDEMEQRGIISARDGAKPRQVLISREEYEQMKMDI